MIMFPPKSVNAGILAPLPQDCQIGLFLRRVKRFSVEIELRGENVWAHCNNSGSMLGLLNKGARAMISPARKKGRKLAWTLEMLELPCLRGINLRCKSDIPWVGVNTGLPNRMLAAAFRAGELDFAKNYTEFRAEAVYGESRLDGLFTGGGLPPLWVECKNVTMVEDNAACFPDAASARGRKHLRALMDIVAKGGRAAMFYLVQRPDGTCFAPADFIDGEYASIFYEALDAGVECYAYRAILSASGAALGEILPPRPPDCLNAP